MAAARQRWGTILLDRLIASAEPIEIRGQLLQTVLQRRAALILSSLALSAMSLSAALEFRAGWAVLWCVLDVCLVGYRLHLAFRHEPREGPAPEWEVRRVIGVSLAIFVLLGLGAGASLHSGTPALQLLAAISVMGLVAGLMSRWAAFPRLAMATMAMVALPAALGLGTAADASVRPAALQLLLIAAGSAALTLQNHRTLLAMLHARAEAARLAATDALTGLPNRGRLMAALAERCATPGPFALLYLDLDGFKAVNDGAGHAAGDAMLQAVGQALAALDGCGMPCRIGGDEFVILLEGDAATARCVAERVSRTVDVAGGGRIGVSIGVALGGDTDGDRLLTCADRALYAAKRGGRGRIVFASGETARAAA